MSYKDQKPAVINSKKITHDFIRQYYSMHQPVVGDKFINAKCEVIDITRVTTDSVDYFLAGKHRGIAGTVYVNTI